MEEEDEEGRRAQRARVGPLSVGGRRHPPPSDSLFCMCARVPDFLGVLPVAKY